jgi:hypothetical protein
LYCNPVFISAISSDVNSILLWLLILL